MNEMLITDNVENIFNPNVMTFDERQKQLEEEEKREEERRKREK